MTNLFLSQNTLQCRLMRTSHSVHQESGCLAKFYQFQISADADGKRNKKSQVLCIKWQEVA